MYSIKGQSDAFKQSLSVESLSLSNRSIITLISNSDIAFSSKEEHMLPKQELKLPMTPHSSPIAEAYYFSYDAQTPDAIIQRSHEEDSIGEDDDIDCSAGQLQVSNDVDDTTVLIEIETMPIPTDTALLEQRDLTRDTATRLEDAITQSIGDDVTINDSENLEEGEKENEYDNEMEEDIDDDADDDDNDDDSSEQDLTNLGWLIDLKNLTTWSDNNNSGERNGTSAEKSNGNVAIRNISFIEDIDDDDGCLGPIISDKDLSEERFNKFMSQVKQ